VFYPSQGELFSLLFGKQSGAQLNDSFTIPVNIPRPLLPCKVHVRPHKTLSHTPNINTTTNNAAPIADRVSRATYRDRESSAIAQRRECQLDKHNWYVSIVFHALRITPSHQYEVQAYRPEIICLHLNIAAEYKR
jgi:hypothetical protein